VIILKILQRYITKELIKSFLMTVGILTTLFFLITAMQMIRKYSSYITFLDVITMSPLLMGHALAFSIPMSMLAATTLFYGKMAQDKEILILRVSGIHAQKIFQPSFLLGGVLCILCFYLNAELMPMALRQRSQLQYKAIDVLLNATFSTQGTNITFIPNFSIRYQTLKDGEFKNIIIDHIENNNISQEILASSGKLTYDRNKGLLTFYLKNGSITNIVVNKKEEVLSSNQKETRFAFQEFTLPIPLSTERKTVKLKVKEKGFKQLMADREKWQGKYDEVTQRIKKLESKSNNQDKEKEILEAKKLQKSCKIMLNDHIWRWHNRIAMALAPLLVVCLGSSLGLLIQHSNRLFAFGVSALPIMLIYYPLQMLGETLTDRMVINPILGAWLGTIVTGGIGIILLWIVYRK